MPEFEKAKIKYLGWLETRMVKRFHNSGLYQDDPPFVPFDKVTPEYLIDVFLFNFPEFNEHKEPLLKDAKNRRHEYEMISEEWAKVKKPIK